MKLVSIHSSYLKKALVLNALARNGYLMKSARYRAHAGVIVCFCACLYVFCKPMLRALTNADAREKGDVEGAMDRIFHVYPNVLGPVIAV